ncbi:MAG: EAL domain-containing protein [Thiotrichaceae bacterium]|nr:EAL domain-containing protein [Thiotrichaceae bacterium]
MGFQDLSIRHKLTTIILFTSLFVLILSSSAFMVNNLWVLNNTMEKNLEVQANIIKVNITPFLQFNEAEDAADILKGLEANVDVVLAQVYKENHLFATYMRKDLAQFGLIAAPNDYKLTSSRQYLQYAQPILSPNYEELGALVVMLDRQALYQRIQHYIMISLVIIFVSGLIALILSAYLQYIITRPILALVEITRQISHYKNYSVRASSNSKDELGILVSGFNTMLSAIQERDEQLQKHRSELEITVTKRTQELKKVNQQLTYQAYHDALTHLPNRALFIKRTEQAINHAQINQEMLAILFIDLDRFKYINDTLGHTAGDYLLQQVAKRLLACTHAPEDTVARLGGDEFTLLLRHLQSPTDAALIANKVLRIFAKPLKYNEHELYSTPSIGISIYPKDGIDVVALMKTADAGMYRAKQQGRNQYCFYTENNDVATVSRLRMENKLRQALEQNEFDVWYQPRYAMPSHKIVGAEALLRWHSPELKSVPPSEFIPLAEDIGLIVPLGEWVLRRACEENCFWRTMDDCPPLHVSVNLSARQFVQEDLLSTIANVIEETQMNPERLELELTESLIMPNAEDTIETLRGLKKLGIQISMDDFGTGYSSLSYLKRFPIDTVKIDQSFIRDIHEDMDDKALVTAIIAMAHSLKLGVVAEGVETTEQLDFLNQYQCDYVQGYLFGRPMPAEQFRELLSHSAIHPRVEFAD